MCGKRSACWRTLKDHVQCPHDEMRQMQLQQKKKSVPPKQSTPSSKGHCTSPKVEEKERKEGKIVSNTNFYNSLI